MIFELEKKFEDYFDFADQANQEFLNCDSEFLRTFKIFHEIFSGKILRGENFPNLLPASLAINSYMLYNAGLRIACSGHSAAIFPTLRTALESACYAFLISHNSDLEKIWLSREESPDKKKQCRKHFDRAVNETAKKIVRMEHTGPDIWMLINDCYDEAINFGGHPNERSVVPFLTLKNREDGLIEVEHTFLHSHGSQRYSQSLIACLDFATVISVVLISCLETPSEEVKNEVQKMMSTKVDLVAKVFPI